MDIDVEIAVHGFRGGIAASVEAEDLRQFLQHLRELSTTLQGSAELRPREEQFVLELAADGLGHIHLKGEAWSRARYENRLEFELQMDQTFLAAPIRELEDVLQENGGDDA
jgi:hypothetical protein